jgi:crotonobetainyl-CoA:carnitine CoA-transferase CaiB-like acyl-CoA transferase
MNEGDRMGQPFEGIKIIDLTNHIAGSFCTKYFADYGADVIKIEKPDRGCLTRHMPPFAGEAPDLNKSLYYLYLNTNKRSITLNLKSDTGKKIFSELVKGANILVESFAPPVSTRLGLKYELLEQINPRLLMASISNFGQTGSYRDFKASELVEFAMGGAMHQTGLPEREPLRKGENALLFETGVQACYAVLGAYMGTRLQGIGDYIDISIMEAQLAGTERRSATLLTYQYTGDVTRRTNPLLGPFSTAPGIQKCADGYLTTSIGPKFFNKFLAIMGRPDLKDDPRWDANNMDMTAEVLKTYDDCFSKKTKKEWAEIYQDAGLVATPLNTPEDVCTDEHWAFREFFVDVNHPEAGEFKYPRGAIRANPDWWEIKTPAPLLGQHNKEIYGGLGYSTDDLAALKAQQVI